MANTLVKKPTGGGGGGGGGHDEDGNTPGGKFPPPGSDCEAGMWQAIAQMFPLYLSWGVRDETNPRIIRYTIPGGSTLTITGATCRQGYVQLSYSIRYNGGVGSD